MTPIRPARLCGPTHATAIALASALWLVVPIGSIAQTSTPKPVAKAKPHAKTPAKKPPPPPAIEYVPADPATPEQIDAAERVYYGIYDCEFKQVIDITKNLKFPAFVDLKHGKATYLMKPVLSSTGAIRLEDIRGETLMVQISSKSMLLNVKTGQRLVDECVSPRQRELIENARAARAAAAASAAEAKAAEASAPPASGPVAANLGVAPPASAPAAAAGSAPSK